MNIDLTQNETEILIEVIDFAIRQKGLKVVPHLYPISEKIKNAIIEESKKPKE